ncbi:hypothetical protein NN561_003315 [Cricetulus griseus]
MLAGTGKMLAQRTSGPRGQLRPRSGQTGSKGIHCPLDRRQEAPKARAHRLCELRHKRELAPRFPNPRPGLPPSSVMHAARGERLPVRSGAASGSEAGRK